jgi:hypothetical protein
MIHTCKEFDIKSWPLCEACKREQHEISSDRDYDGDLDHRFHGSLAQRREREWEMEEEFRKRNRFKEDDLEDKGW